MGAALQQQLSRLTVTIGTVRFETWQVIAIVVLLFLLVITLASVRHHLLEWTVKGAGFGVALGFLLALVVEGFFLVGGRTILIGALGWKDAPKPIQKVLDLGKEKFTQVLSVSTPSASLNQQPRAEDVITKLQELTPSENQKAKKIICAP